MNLRVSLDFTIRRRPKAYLPTYYNKLKNEVDEEYRSKIHFLETSQLSYKTIIVNEDYKYNYVP